MRELPRPFSGHYGLLGNATQGGAEVVREPANDYQGRTGSTENTKDNQ
jgi:hypothetical protein